MKESVVPGHSPRAVDSKCSSGDFLTRLAFKLFSQIKIGTLTLIDVGSSRIQKSLHMAYTQLFESRFPGFINFRQDLPLGRPSFDET